MVLATAMKPSKMVKYFGGKIPALTLHICDDIYPSQLIFFYLSN